MPRLELSNRLVSLFGIPDLQAFGSKGRPSTALTRLPREYHRPFWGIAATERVGFHSSSSSHQHESAVRPLKRARVLDVMNPWLSSYTLALGAIFLVWLGVSGYVIVTRALFDVADLSFHTGRRVLERRLARLGSPEAALAGLPRRTLAGIAADASTPPEIARAAARRLLERHSHRVVNHARGRHWNEAQKWRRISSLR